MGVLFLLFFVLVAHASSSAYNTQTPRGSRLLILFLDGLRWDYFNHLEETGGFGQMRIQGCHVPRVRPVFPANCHANVHALFGGLSLSSVGNFSETFQVKYTHPKLIWNRAIEQGKTVNLLHFPFCSDFVEMGMSCIQPITPRPGLATTLEGALQSLINRTVDLAVVYYGELDRVAHIYGPSSEEVKNGESILEVDGAIAHVLQSLRVLKDENINFAIVADHGMTEFKDFLALDRVFKWSHVNASVNFGSTFGLWPTPGAETDLTESLSMGSHFHVYTKETMPVTSWHPSQLPPIILVADPGYVFHVSHHPLAMWDHLSEITTSSRPRGVHGYFSNVSDMHTTFLGYGSAFKPGCGRSDEDIHTFDLFPLLNDALFGGDAAEPPRENALKAGWEMKLLAGILFALIGIALILGVALRYLLRTRMRNADALVKIYADEMDDYDEDGEMKV